MCRCHFLFTITLHCSYRESFVRDKHIGCFTEQLVCSNIRVHSVGDPLLLLITVPEATHALLKGPLTLTQVESKFLIPAIWTTQTREGGVQSLLYGLLTIEKVESNPCYMDYSP